MSQSNTELLIAIRAVYAKMTRKQKLDIMPHIAYYSLEEILTYLSHIVNKGELHE